MDFGSKKYILLGFCAVILVASITFASAQTEISVSKCSLCHNDITFDAANVNRSLTCVNCHLGYPSYHSGQKVLTEFGYFTSGDNSNIIAPDVHDKHIESKSYAPCTNCHRNIDCTDCHRNTDVLHISHSSDDIIPVTCESSLCHDRNIVTIIYNTVPYGIWTMTPTPTCENCHNDNSVPLHNITAIHQSTPAIALDCQTCHSNYLPDTHADIANRSYSNDSCAVCHQSTNITVMSAIANNDTNCATCHTLHGDITEIHTLNTTTSILNCPECHQPAYLPDLHNNFAVENGLPTSCSVCHSNANISISIASAECTSCHDSQLDKPHLNANHTSVSDCIICHDDADLPIIHLDNCSVCHNNPTKVNIDSATNECRSCHVDQNVGYHSNMNDSHSSTTDCTTCHETDLPTVHLDNCSTCHVNSAINITLATADCNSCHVDQNIGYHSNMSDKHTSTSGCTNCHKDSYLPVLHNDFALANGMTNCTVCHDNKNYPINISEANSDCTTCHGQQLPTQHANESEKHTTNTCAICHGSATGSYLPDTHNATVNNGRCDLCHNNVAIDISNSTSNCTSCHGIQVNEPHYNESVKHTFDSPTECDECHGMYIPTIHVGQYDNVNCFSCHRNNPSITKLPTDKNCTSCHGEQLPVQHLNEASKHNGSSLSGCLGCHESLAGSNDLKVIHNDNCTVCHDNANVKYLGATDCMDCHADSNVGYHTNMDNNHTTTVCANCHGVSGEVDLPTAHNDNCSLCHNNPAITLPTSADCGYCHRSQTPNVDHHDNELSPLHAFEVPAQCAGCHDMNLTQTHSTQSLNCNMCHKVHNNESGPYLFADFANAASVEGTNCFVCHDNANITTLPTDKNCSSCHGSQLRTQHVNESSKHNSSTLTDGCITCHKTNYLPDLHKNEGYDCNTCHNNANTSRINWNNATSSCDSCHTLHGDLTVVHTTTESTGCIKCHDASVLTTHDEVCSTCHGNPLIPTLPDTPECTNCHGANALVPAHNFQSGNSYHPTEVVGTNDIISSQAFVNGWSASSITGCDDCHGDRGADGLIKLLNPYPERYPDGNHNGQSSSDLCFNCHNYNTYAGNLNSNSNFVGDGGKNLHPGNYGHHGDFGCYVCHDVHTSTNRRLITDRVDPKTGDKWMTSWVQNSGSYNKNDCVSSHPECGDHNPGSKSVTPAVITGTVTKNGTAVKNAKVSSDAYGGIVAYTDASGHYEIPNLYYGTYSLTATANGMSQTKSISVNKGDSKVLNIDLSGISTTPIPPTNPPVSGEGYKLSKNPDFSTEDRDYSTSNTIYVKVWSDRVDYTDMDRMYFEIRDVTSSITLKNNNDGTFTGSYDLSRTSKTGERDFRIRLRDNRGEEYRVDTRITISESFSHYRR
ncbi:MAG: carboxypeptidase regulatory-like domain-containing protein [Methanosarcinaceae archaeon]|nr:carboxypeptidase regulatory-like domain-containing protein [Methanosarcinaceae archaeon]